MISIIIPLYNKAHTIINTLNTVINQSYKDFEIIIVNDGSTDNGVEIISNSFNDSRIKIFNQTIPRTETLAETASEGVSIFSYDAKSKGAYSYQILAQEVLNHA